MDCRRESGSHLLLIRYIGITINWHLIQRISRCIALDALTRVHVHLLIWPWLLLLQELGPMIMRWFDHDPTDSDSESESVETIQSSIPFCQGRTHTQDFGRE